MRRHYLFAAILTLAVVVPRSVLIQRAHSESWDDQYHLVRGMYFLVGHGFEGYLNDPPLGEALIALPMLLAGCTIEAPTHHPDYEPWNAAGPHGVLYGQPLKPETIMQMLAAWKAVLFVPVALLVFHWCATVYGVASAWLALAMVLVDPTIAAHIAVPALDVFAMSALFLVSWLQWRWSVTPSRQRFALMCVAMAAALLTKNTLILLPFIGIVFLVMNRPGGRSPRLMFRQIGAAALLTAFLMWVMLGFDVSVPKEHGPMFATQYTEDWNFVGDVINPALSRRWPAGIYLGSLAKWMDQAINDPAAFVLGRNYRGGVWFYYPVVVAYKVPLGLALVGALGFASLWTVRTKRDELMLLVPLVVYGSAIVFSSVQPGFRHALPAYLLIFMLASRCLSDSGKAWKVVAWTGVALAGIHSAWWHPNYLSYVNFPRHRVWLDIGDPNLDWGQGLKQVREWIDTHAATRKDVYLVYEGNLTGFSPKYYVGDRVRQLPPGPLPSGGLLIISPMFVSGAHLNAEQFAILRHLDPDAIIGECMLVFDLAKVNPPASQPDATNPQ